MISKIYILFLIKKDDKYLSFDYFFTNTLEINNVEFKFFSNPINNLHYILKQKKHISDKD